jgi:membrane-bound metal-dependent hydrolase YbcI (DUF457 family)
MASYQGHLATSVVLAGAYGSAAAWFGEMDWGSVYLGAGLTALGGLLPDLDSDSGVPVRELFSVAAAAVPCLLFRRLMAAHFTTEQTLVILGALYLFIRYVFARVFRNLTVHRGMYHSIPALFISGLVVFLCYESPNLYLRVFLAGGVMIGFLSHLVLDEICAVDLMGARLRLNRFAGSALKFFSPSWKGTAFAYLVLFGLIFFAYVFWEPPK